MDEVRKLAVLETNFDSLLLHCQNENAYPSGGALGEVGGAEKNVLPPPGLQVPDDLSYWILSEKFYT